ncbi:heterokaryon incompatibility protein-domain-containing protein [Apiospora marii]|uniref:Heterokaryon incompatibility protein-domain-containing protein n=1 Tax=Apiospora marii TaxID=335849 RepID=A0ABR1RAI0_9PEZI
MVELLLSKGADVSPRTNEGHTPFSQICGSKDHEAVADILIASGAKKNITLLDGTSALHNCAASGETDKVRTMLRRGLNPSFRTHFGWTPLHWAAKNGHLGIVNLLVEADPDVNPISDTLKTPLDLVRSQRDSNDMDWDDMDWIRACIIANGGMTTRQILCPGSAARADNPSGASQTSSLPSDAVATELAMPLYQPLNKDEREIRLLLIEKPGVSSDMPSCLLQAFPIDEAPPYYALSYTWGDASITRPVLINKHKVVHTINAIAAITTLRQMLPLETIPNVRHIWLDAICIDQSNITEKNSQIPLMGDIYSKAKRVLVWLGEENDGSSAAMGLLVQLGYMSKLMSVCKAVATTVCDPGTSCPATKEDEPVFKIEIGRDKEPGIPGVELTFNKHLPDHGVQLAFTNQLSSRKFNSVSDVLSTSWRDQSVKPRWDAMGQLFRRPYWTRSWILQEIGLASANPSPLLICGKKVLTWYTFRNAIVQLSQLVSQGDLMMATEEDPEPYTESLGGWIMTDALKPLEPIRWILDRPAGRADYDMIDLVCFTSHSVATNPRDKIYALLGLASPEKRSRIVPDYALPVNQVYTDFALAEIQRSGKLDVLCLEHQLTTHKKVANLPSWVIDLTAQTRREAPPSLMRSSPHIKERARASDGEPHIWCVPGNEGELTVRGIHCCTVRSIKPPPLGHVYQDWYDYMKSWLDFTRENLPEELLAGIPRNQVLFRTFIRDMSGTGPPSHEMDPRESRRLRRMVLTWKALHEAWQVQPDEVSPPMPTEEFKHLLHHQHDDISGRGRNNDECWGFERGKLRQKLEGEMLSLMNFVIPANCRFALFTTAKGYLGLGPRYMDKGDVLVVLAGMRVPAILRPIHDHYIFLGDCYVYDLMQGQAVRSAREEGRGFEEFILR